MVQSQVRREGDIMHKETGDQVYKRARKQQREARGAKAKYAQLRQEIADAGIAFVESNIDDSEAVLTTYQYLEQMVKELRALEQQYPHLKDVT